MLQKVSWVRPRTIFWIPSAALSRHAIRVLVVTALLFGLLLASAGAILIRNGYLRTIAETKREFDTLSLVMIDQADRALQTVDLLLDSVVAEVADAHLDSAAEFNTLMSRRTVQDALTLRAAPLPQVNSVSLINASGDIVNISGTWPAPNVNVHDRDYFEAFLADPNVKTMVSRPIVSRVDGSWAVHVVRRLTARDGSFLGVALVAIQLDYFQKLYASVAPSPDYAFTLLRSDGVMIVRYPARADWVGQAPAFTLPEPSSSTGIQAGMFRHVSMIDGQERLGVVRAVPHYPLYLRITRTLAATLAPWRARTRLQISAITAMELALLGMVLLGVRQIRARAELASAQSARAAAEERERARRNLLAHYTRFATVLENLTHGLCVFDDANTLVVANQRMAEMFNLAKPPHAGESLAGCLSAIQAAGGLQPIEMRRTRAAIRSLLAAGIPRRGIWQLADGRSLAITFQPMRESGGLLTFDDVTEQRAAEARLAFMAHHDPLTGLPNRALFRERLEYAIEVARNGSPCALICLDLDGFKEVNDTLGHGAGDLLLQDVGRRLIGCVRDTDTIARLGGDEFAIIRTGLQHSGEAGRLAQRIVTELTQPYVIQGKTVVAGVSVGIALSPPDGRAAEILLRHADVALYCAKQQAGSGHRFFDTEMNFRLEARRTLQADLAEALSTGQLELYYQPLVCAATRKVLGFEALLRWYHPVRGLVLPSDFIEVAEETGLIVPVGEWVLQQACAEASTWPDDLKVAVNLSPAQFRNGTLIQAVVSALQQSRLPASRLELEITESVLLNDTAETAAIIGQLRGLGAALVMDDFGTGYSSLGYLHRIPFDKVKVDRSFVHDLGHRREALAIVRAIAGICRHLNIAMLAEGVETEEQVAMLRSEGCKEMQGFLFGRPCPAAALPALIERLGADATAAAA
jgi:diguanylate cyclase (GGDEF)-like protein